MSAAPYELADEDEDEDMVALGVGAGAGLAVAVAVAVGVAAGAVGVTVGVVMGTTGPTGAPLTVAALKSTELVASCTAITPSPLDVQIPAPGAAEVVAR